MNYKLEIEKIAKSYDARRKKQYQQLLKRMYGGTDAMVDSLSKSRDYGIYHGTKNLDSVMKEGLKASTGEGKSIASFGKGVYLGDKELASSYGANGIVRLKMPSELKGTKTLYPKTTKAMKADIKINPKLTQEAISKYRAYGDKELYKKGLMVNGKKSTDIHPGMMSVEVRQQLFKDPAYIKKNLDKAEYAKNGKKEIQELMSDKLPPKKFKKLKRSILTESLKSNITSAPTENQFIYRGNLPQNLLVNAKSNPINTKIKFSDNISKTPTFTPNNLNTGKSLSRNAKIGLGLGTGALALGAGAYGLKKIYDKKKQEKTAMEV